MTEQLAFQQRFRNGRAINFDQRTGNARAPGVDDVGQHFLAHAALPGDEDPAFGRGNERNIAKQRLHQRAPGDDMPGQLLAFAKPHRRSPRDASRLADRSEQLIEVDRFGEIVDRPIAHGAHGLANVRICGYEQHGQDRVLLARAPKGFQARDAGHAHVGNHHVEVPAAQNLQRPFAGGDRDSVKTLGLQKRIKQAALACVVIDDQHTRRFRRVVGGIRRHGRRSSLPSASA